jgi:hypothetical protein
MKRAVTIVFPSVVGSTEYSIFTDPRGKAQRPPDDAAHWSRLSLRLPQCGSLRFALILPVNVGRPRLYDVRAWSETSKNERSAERESPSPRAASLRRSDS